MLLRKGQYACFFVSARVRVSIRSESMLARLKERAKRSPSVIIAYKVYGNWKVRRRFQQGDIESGLGATHLAFRSAAESLGYIQAQYEDYLKYGELTPTDLAGKRIFELGFGDNVGVALKFLAAGAEKVVCLDKFVSKSDLEQQRRIYHALRATLSLPEQRRFDQAVDLSSGVKTNPAKLQCLYGVDVQEAKELFAGPPFDLAVSRSVIQDIFDPAPAFEAMDRFLAPGGLMLHKIDLSDQGMFRDAGLNPLTFLTISDAVYERMAVDSGQSNRKLRGYYREQMTRLGCDARFVITDVTGRKGKGDLYPHTEKLDPKASHVEDAADLVRQIRPRLNPRYRALTDEELMICGIFLIAKKRGTS
jgi:SAM-dependent methyltransferase